MAGALLLSTLVLAEELIMDLDELEDAVATSDAEVAIDGFDRSEWSLGANLQGSIDPGGLNPEVGPVIEFSVDPINVIGLRALVSPVSAFEYYSTHLTWKHHVYQLGPWEGFIEPAAGVVRQNGIFSASTLLSGGLQRQWGSGFSMGGGPALEVIRNARASATGEGTRGTPFEMVVKVALFSNLQLE